MNTLIRILKWVWRLWPLIILAFVISIHFLILCYSGFPDKAVNAAVSLVVQIIGGLLVLYSIDSNIGLFRNLGLVDTFKNYLSAFPLIKKHYVLNADSAHFDVSGGDVDLIVNRKPKNVEEHLAYLQEQIDTLKQRVNNNHNKMQEKIESVNKVLTEKSDKTGGSVSDIQNKLEVYAIGGLKTQIFGVLLIIYGAIASYAA